MRLAADILSTLFQFPLPAGKAYPMQEKDGQLFKWRSINEESDTGTKRDPLENPPLTED